MLIARWQIDARFGHKQKVIDSIVQWTREIAPQVGLLKGRMLSGSIGALEATVEHNWEVEDLAELERAWASSGPSRPTSNGARTSSQTSSRELRAGASFAWFDAGLNRAAGAVQLFER